MRKINCLVFDEFVPASAAPPSYYTAAAWNERLGAFDKLAIQAVADNVTGAAATLTVQIEHSADARNWVSKTAQAEINALSITATPAVLQGADATTTASFGFVRFRIQLAANSSAHVKVWCTARDTVP
jgi:hypothetical protein